MNHNGKSYSNRDGSLRAFAGFLITFILSCPFWLVLGWLLWKLSFP